MKRLVFSIISCVSMVIACGETNVSDTRIDGGIFITGGLDNTVPAVMWIGNCTSTAVSHNTLVTAAHCVVRGGQVQAQVCIRSGLVANGKCSANVFVPPRYLASEYMPNDVAVVVFPDNTFTHFFDLNPGRVALNQPVVLVGYSDDNRGNADAAKGSKRWGKNVVRAINGDGANTIVTAFNGSSEGVAVSPGDSGGPMFSGCKLSAVASRMSTGAQKLSLHTNLMADNGSFLRGLESRGAYYCGLTGSDATSCPKTGRATPIANPQATAEGPGFPCGVSGDGTTTPPPAALFLAINPDANDRTRLFIAAEERMDAIRICRGIVSGCEASQVAVRERAGVNGRVVYVTESAIDLGGSEVEYTIQGLKAGRTAALSQFKIAKR